MIIQINGKVRDKIEIKKGILDKEAEEKALRSPKIGRWIAGKKIKRIIFVKDKLINFVI